MGDDTIFSKRLKQVRKEKGLTLDALATLYNERFNGGLNKGTLSKYENNKQEPMISVISNLSILLDVSVDYLLCLNSSPKQEMDNDIIITIQRAAKNATPKQQEKMLKLMKLGFEDLFDDD